MDDGQLKEGAKAALPIALGYLPVGVAFGVLARKAGLTPVEAGSMSFLNSRPIESSDSTGLDLLGNQACNSFSSSSLPKDSLAVDENSKVSKKPKEFIRLQKIFRVLGSFYPKAPLFQGVGFEDDPSPLL